MFRYLSQPFNWPLSGPKPEHRHLSQPLNWPLSGRRLSGETCHSRSIGLCQEGPLNAARHSHSIDLCRDCARTHPLDTTRQSVGVRTIPGRNIASICRAQELHENLPATLLDVRAFGMPLLSAEIRPDDVVPRTSREPEWRTSHMDDLSMDLCRDNVAFALTPRRQSDPRDFLKGSDPTGPWS